MSVRYYCDCCGNELQRDCVGDRYKPVLEVRAPEGFVQNRIYLEVMVGTGSRNTTAWNSGHLCLDCLKRTINEGVERRG